MGYNNFCYKHEMLVVRQMPWDLPVRNDIAEVVIQNINHLVIGDGDRLHPTYKGK